MTLWRPGMRTTADRLNSVLMDWTDLSSLGTFQGSFTAGIFPPRMRKLDEAGTEVWELEGDINMPSITLSTLHTPFIFSTGHRVSSTRYLNAGGASVGFHGFWLSFTSAGNINAGLPSSASSSASTILSLDGVRITNPV